MMADYSIIDKIRSLAQRVSDMNGVELIEVELAGREGKSLLKVVIDKAGGVSLSDCETVSRDLEALLDVEDPIAGAYTLEVSSPGLDRPLKKLDDFVRQKGKKARIVIDGSIDNQSFFVGIIQDIRGEEIVLDIGKKTVSVDFNRIKKARLEIEF
ncbi:MAG: ribosome maturation factor RimP [bacterium]